MVEFMGWFSVDSTTSYVKREGHGKLLEEAFILEPGYEA
jgi:hypothetical protein